ncbi:MAG TPA: TonB-dependent receptor [Bacteroidota bacterium]|nr:TonB-dependent receptor [Bacteroidota bacterium]
MKLLPRSFPRCAITLLLLAAVRGASAQTPAPGGAPEPTDIRGVVSDSATGERIPGANVMLGNTGRGASTNNLGFYLISSVPAGTYQITVSAVGFARRTVTVTVTDGKSQTLNVRLGARLIEERELVVESHAISSLAERSASVHVITPAEIKQLPTVGQQDLLRSLQILPGIASTSDVSARFFVRGGAGDQNLILLDGMRIYNPYHAFGLFSVLDPDIIRNAEVYTGAFPAGYGGRLSSVVNVTTRDGNMSKISGNASASLLSGKLELDGPLGEENSWMVNGRSSLLTGSIDRLIPNSSPMSFDDLFFKATVGTSTGRFGLRAFTSADDVRPVGIDQPDYSWRSQAVAGVFSSLLADRLYLDATTSYSHSAIAQNPKAGGAIHAQSSELNEATFRAEMTSFLEGGNTLFEGFEFNFPSISDSLYVRNLFPRAYADAGLEWYTWVRYQGVAGQLRYDLGVHADVVRVIDGGPLLQCLQPRITLTWDFGQSWLAKASYGIFTQNLITVSNEDDLISLFDAWVWLPDRLRPEEARHYVLGLEGNLLPSLATSVQVYLKDFRSLTLYNADKIFPDDPDYISGTGIARGLEVLLRYGTSLMDLYASYSLSDVTVSANDITYAPRYDRRHTVKATGTIHLLAGLDATLRWEYGSGYPFTQAAGQYTHLLLGEIDTDPYPEGGGATTQTLGAKNAARLPAYHRIDGGISYRQAIGMFRATAGLSIINLTNTKNILYYDRASGKTDYMIPLFPTASLTLEF